MELKEAEIKLEDTMFRIERFLFDKLTTDDALDLYKMINELMSQTSLCVALRAKKFGMYGE